MTPPGAEALWRLAVPLALAALLAVIDWAAVWVGGPAGRRLELVAKPGTMAALLAAAALAIPGTPEAAETRPWLLAGLAASLAGDVLLLVPGAFAAGLVAFLLAHLAYLGAFLRQPGEAAWLVAGIVAAVLVATTIGRTLVGAAARGGLGRPVGTYLVAILLMAVAATRTAAPVAIAGAWLFVASDALLGWGRFADRAPARDSRGGRGLRTAVMVTYHVGQGLIVLALVGAGIAEGVGA